MENSANQEIMQAQDEFIDFNQTFIDAFKSVNKELSYPKVDQSNRPVANSEVLALLKERHEENK